MVDSVDELAYRLDSGPLTFSRESITSSDSSLVLSTAGRGAVVVRLRVAGALVLAAGLRLRVAAALAAGVRVAWAIAMLPFSTWVVLSNATSAGGGLPPV
jgi:hypothetical protein